MGEVKCDSENPALAPWVGGRGWGAGRKVWACLRSTDSPRLLQRNALSSTRRRRRRNFSGRPSSRQAPAATARRSGQGMKPLRRARQRASLDRSEHRGTRCTHQRLCWRRLAAASPRCGGASRAQPSARTSGKAKLPHSAVLLRFLDLRASILFLLVRGLQNPRGARGSDANIASQPCIRWIPIGIATMMQACASTAKLRGGRPNLLGRHIVHGSWRVTAASDRYRQLVADADERRNPRFLLLLGRAVHRAGRTTTPSGTSPAVTNRQSAMRSLRASATINVFRPLPEVARASNHCVRALCFWCIRKRHAS